MVDLLFRGRRLLFETALSREEITRRLQREVAPVAWRRYENRPHRFEGTFDVDQFRMMRLVRGRNSFRPVIEGRILAAGAGARVEVRLRLHPAALALSAIIAMIGLLVAVLALSELATGSALSPAWPFILGLAVVFSVFMGATIAEASKATRLLTDLFEAPPSATDVVPAPSAPP